MDKKKKEIIITLILIIVLVVVISVRLRKKLLLGKEAKPLVLKAKTSSGSSQVNQVKANKDIIDSQIKRAKLPWGRDPFSFANPKKIRTGRNLSLKGISLNEKGRGYAFINDEIVTVGDTISGYKVIEVKRDKVLLRKGEDSFYLGMPEE